MAGSFLDALTEQQRADLLARSPDRGLAPGEVLFHEGTPGDTVYLVGSGRLAVEVTTLEGHTATLRVVGPGDVVGELALLLPGAVRSATVVAIESARVRPVQAAAFDELRRRNPAIDRALVADLAHRLDSLSRQLVVARYGTVTESVARQLLVLDDLYDHDWIPVTQESLASLTGGTRQTVNRVLRAATEDGLVARRRGAVRVLDRPGLEARVD